MPKTIDIKDLRRFATGYNTEFFPVLKPFKIRKKTYSDFVAVWVEFYGHNMHGISGILTFPDPQKDWAEFNRALSAQFPGAEAVTDNGRKSVSKSIFDTAHRYAAAFTSNIKQRTNEK